VPKKEKFIGAFEAMRSSDLLSLSFRASILRPPSLLTPYLPKGLSEAIYIAAIKSVDRIVRFSKAANIV
jgi:hypothetical protein